MLVILALPLSLVGCLRLHVVLVSLHVGVWVHHLSGWLNVVVLSILLHNHLLVEFCLFFIILTKMLVLKLTVRLRDKISELWLLKMFLSRVEAFLKVLLLD